MSREQLLKARDLIRAKHYDEARQVLYPIRTHPTAQKWLERLNEIAPHFVDDRPQPNQRASSGSSRRWLYLGLSVAVVALVAVGVFAFLREGAPATATLPTPVSTEPAPNWTIHTLQAVADTYVSQTDTSTNYGGRPILRADGTPPVHSYLRFVVPDLSGMVSRATLRLYANSSSSVGYDVYEAEGSWDEAVLTYADAPAYQASVGSSGAFDENTWTEVDVTTVVSGASEVTLVLVSTDKTAMSFSSREGANPPELLVEVAGDGSST